MSMPMTAIPELRCDMACSLSSLPQASFLRWRGWSTAGPSHYPTWARLRRSPGGNEGLCSLDQIRLIQRQYVAAHKGDLHLIVPQRFFVQGRRAQGDRHLYASRTRFIPEELLGLFERTTWPVVSADTAARMTSRGPKLDISARTRGMWR